MTDTVGVRVTPRVQDVLQRHGSRGTPVDPATVARDVVALSTAPDAYLIPAVCGLLLIQARSLSFAR